MKLITQKNNSCILYSLAMCLNLDPQELITYAGHDGTEMFGDKDRAYTIEEFVTFLFNRGYCAIPFVRRAGYNGKVINFKNDPPLHYQGILIYGNHAVAWDGEHIYDPRGKVTNFNQDWDVFWLIELLLNNNF